MKKILMLFSLLLFAGTLAVAQTVQISGTVTSSEDGMPIPGVTITVKGTTLGIITAADGKYTLSVPSTAQTLVFSFVGFKTFEVPIQGQTKIDVVLEMDLVRVDEVVVTALGIQRESKALGYSVQSVGTEQLTRSGAINPVNSLGVKVAGVQVTNSTGAAGGSSFITIRGMSSITGNNQPLFVVDGIPIDNSQLNTETGTAGVAYSNRAIDLNSSDIESMNVLKGGAATALYGIRAAKISNVWRRHIKYL